MIAAYDFTGRREYQTYRPTRHAVAESFHFPGSEDREHYSTGETGDVAVAYPEGRNAKSAGRRAKLTSEFQVAATATEEQQTEHYPAAGQEEARYLSPQAIAKISETLGAINTVGRYLVNYTRGTTDDRLDRPAQTYPVSKYI